MNEDSAAFGAADRKEQAVMTTWVQFWQTFQEIFRYTWAHMVWINLVLAIIIIFFQRKEAKSAWAWLLALNVLPGLGFLMYLLAGTDMHKRKMFKIKGIEEQINDAVRRQEYSVKSRELEQENPDLKDFSDLVFFNLESAGCMISGDNAVEIFTDGNDKFDALIEDIKNAESYIFLQYYIIKDDVLFQRIREALLEKAAQGVEIRILYDAMGCRSVGKHFWKEMEKQGIHVAVFFPALFGRLHLRVNYRNHRKIAVIDGKVAYVGGFNIGKEYIGLDACAANLMRPAMYGSYHHITVMGKEDAPCDHKYDITGGLCENNDKFAIDRMLPEINIGDLLFIHDAGAHGFAMGYNYNGKLRSAEVLLKEDGSTELIRRAETPADYFATFDFTGLFKNI